MSKIFKKYYTIFFSLFVFIIYLFTIAPSVIQIDSGELAAVQATLGIAHPTGYPLFSILGYLFSLIPFPFGSILKLNILAALWCAAAAGVFVYTAKFILDKILSVPSEPAVTKSVKSAKKNKAPVKVKNKFHSYGESEKFTAIISGGIILALSKTFWFQSVSVEVYSLHILLISLIVLFLLKGFFQNENEFRISLKNNWIIFAFFLALGFTNHMTTLLILPGTAYLFFSKYKFSAESFKKIGLMLLIFFPALIVVYLYLPLRAMQDPVINWGNPIDFENFFRHVSGKQYQVWLFSSIEAAKKQFSYFVNNLPAEFAASSFIILIGLLSSISYSKKIYIFLLITFASVVLYSINYDINDIDSYFLLAYISLAFFAVFGSLKIISILKNSNSKYYIAAGLIALLIAVQGYINYGKVDQSGNYAFEDYTKALINSTTKDAVIFSYQWDYFISASYYFQFVENFRRDAAIVDKELLRRSWYYHQLKTAYPGLLDGIQKEENNFLKSLRPFERDEKFDAALLERLFRQLMTNLAAANLEERDFYIAPEVFENEMQRGEFVLPEGYNLVPDLFLFKAVRGSEYVPASEPDFKIRLPEKRNIYINNIENFIGNMLVRRALYEMQFDETEKAKKYIDKIKSDLPNYIIPAGISEAIGN
jgi:hypothetical protein